ncbi:17.8 kDa class I heat shock protein-like [Argentina anserina]|uniref:17.8 kDa class I heat shock protein-like n=1 Tax=Argentina anserina TaxID=57926 RepID=UPI00217621EC|nr:17.8 kDa class I heat shock protein-like [Potentilla anserina]
MSIIPINDQRSSRDFDPSALDLWDPFLDFPLFPSSLSNVFHQLNPSSSSLNSRFDWSETRNAHVLKAALPAFADEDVLVELQEERVLQISTDSGSFMTKVKLPESAKIEELKAFMSNGVVTVTVPKVEARRPNVRVIEISGED